jgi:hypothetical protein
MNKPITVSCISGVLEKQIVRRAKRLIRVRKEGSPDRSDYFLPLLAAQQRMLEAHGYPVGAPGAGKV